MKLRTGRLTGAVVAAIAFLPASAFACGGFFCFTQPIDQSAERVLYVQDGTKIEVHIQISYTGEDDKFSWILPLQSAPELGIGSDSIFQILEQETSPRFQLQWNNTKDCQGYPPCRMFDAAAGGGSSGGSGNGGGVQVLDQGNVGPYDYVVLKSGNADELINWLNKNKYVQPKESKPLIESYVKKQHVFLALKLSKDSNSGDIAPIVVKLDESSPCLPIRLTQIAAQPDMPIVTWTLGPARAIPKNFLHVILNDAVFDWLRPGANYKTVVSKAVDQASGHAFTTEYAKQTDKWKRKFANKSWDPSKLESITDPSTFLMKLLEYGYPRTTQMQNLIRKHLPKPAKYKDVKDNAYYNCLGQQWNTKPPCSDYKAAAKAQGFDAKKFVVDLVKYVIEPLQKMDSDIAGHAWMTRLYTTLDPQEMDKDPIFAFNKTLPAVDNTRTATAHPICDKGKKVATKAKLVFADKHELTVDIPTDNKDCQWQFNGGVAAFGKGTDAIKSAGGQPAKEIQVLDETGAPLAIHPADADKVDAALNGAEAGKPSLTPEFKKDLRDPAWKYTDPKFDPGPASSSGGTSSSSGSSGGSSTSGGTSTSSGGSSTSSGGGDSSGCTAGSSQGSQLPTALLVMFALGALFVRRRVA